MAGVAGIAGCVLAGVGLGFVLNRQEKRAAHHSAAG